MTFLAGVTVGTRTSDQITALAQRAREQQAQRKDFLEISVEASHPSTVHSSEGELVVIHLQMHISQPRALHGLKVWEGLAGSGMVELVAEYGRQAIGEKLEFDIRLKLPDEAHVIPENRKLPRAFDLYISIELEHFMNFGRGAEPYVVPKNPGRQFAELWWPDFEVDLIKQWSLPISRVIQQSSTSSGEIWDSRFTELTEPTVEKESHNMFSKKK